MGRQRIGGDSCHVAGRHGRTSAGERPCCAEGADGEGVVALGEADAVLVGEELGVEVVWAWGG